MKAWLFLSVLTSVWTAKEVSASSPLNSGFMQQELLASSDQLETPLIPHLSEEPPAKKAKEEEGSKAATDDSKKEHADEPEGGSAPLVQFPKVKWNDESGLPKGTQWTVACVWIAMLASLPFLIPVVEQKPVTKTQMIVGGSVLVVVTGGFYLFTNIILFQSVHFKDIRPLTTIECIYLMSQLITTVGYGDITPAKIRGQVFVGLYVLGALFVIAMLISDLTTHVVKMAHQYQHKRFLANNPDFVCDKVKDVNALIHPVRPSVVPFLRSLAIFAVIDICWIAFFSSYPGENKTVFQATYMSVITLSSVGLGWFTPLTEMGMIFGAFFMLFGTGALVSVIGNFTELMVKMNEYERVGQESTDEALAVLKQCSKGSNDITELQFFDFSLLHCGVKRDVLDHIHEAFDRMGPKDGKVNFKTIEDLMSEVPLYTPRTPRPEA